MRLARFVCAYVGMQSMSNAIRERHFSTLTPFCYFYLFSSVSLSTSASAINNAVVERG